MGSIIFIALCAFSILGFIFLGAKGYTFESLPAFLQTIKEGGFISSYVIFPLLVTGLCSMVFSSADTSVIAIIYAISDKNTFLNKLSKMDEGKLRHTLSVLIFSILILLTVIYCTQFSGLQDWLIPLTYTFCGVTSILAPIPIYILIKLAKRGSLATIHVTRGKALILCSGIIAAWGLLLFSAYLTKTTTIQLYSQLSVPIGFLIISGVGLVVCKSFSHVKGGLVWRQKT